LGEIPFSFVKYEIKNKDWSLNDLLISNQVVGEVIVYQAHDS